MFAQYPEISGLRHRRLRRLGHLVHRGARLSRGSLQLVEQRVQILRRVADAFERVLGLELLEDARQALGIPVGQFGGAVERDAERRRIDAFDGQLDHVALGPPEGLHGFESSMPRNHAARSGLYDERLGLTEASQAGLDGLQVRSTVLTDVAGVGVQAIEGDTNDLQTVAGRRRRG